MRKVAVTGVGVFVPGKQSASDLFSALSSGESLVEYDDRLADLGIPDIASSAVSSDELATLGAVYPVLADNDICPSGKMAFHAFKSSIKDSGLSDPGSSDRCGLFFGVNKNLISPDQLFSMWQRFDIQKQKLAPAPEYALNDYHLNRPDRVVRLMVNDLDLDGPVLVSADACAAGASTILSGYRRIRSGSLDIAICGAADEGSQPMMQLVFNKIGASSNGSYATAQEVSRPFDKDRSGCVLADGAAFLVLEELNHALNRGAQILAVVSGGARSSEAYKITSTRPDGSYYADTMTAALRDANLAEDSVDHISAHGTATRSNDLAEGWAIRNVFGPNVPVTSTKSALGHSLAGSGAVESVLCIESLRQQSILPTLNFNEVAGDEAEINVNTQAKSLSLNHILSNSFGFGGLNTALIFSRYV